MDTFDFLKLAHSLGRANKDYLFQTVVNNTITSEQYRQITGEEFEMSIEMLRKKIIADMSALCEQKIVNEFYSDCLGGDSLHYGCKKDEDQPWIMGKYFKAGSILQSNPELADTQLETLAWKNQDAPACFPFTPNQMILLGENMEAHLTEKKNRFYILRIWASDENRTAEELRGWSWDMELST